MRTVEQSGAEFMRADDFLQDYCMIVKPLARKVIKGKWGDQECIEAELHCFETRAKLEAGEPYRVAPYLANYSALVSDWGSVLDDPDEEVLCHSLRTGTSKSTGNDYVAPGPLGAKDVELAARYWAGLGATPEVSEDEIPF